MAKESRRPGRRAKADFRKYGRKAAQELRELKRLIPQEGHSYEKKLANAYAHLETLRGEVAAWAGSHPYTWSVEYDPSEQEQIYFAELTDPPFDRFGSLAGDCLHNMRAALDHLVFEASEVALGQPLPQDVAEKTEFPIFGPKPLDAKSRKRRIGLLPEEAQVLIEGMQPHTYGTAFTEHPLWVLHDLERIDKHRLPVSARPMFHDMLITVPATAGIRERPGGRAKYSVSFNTEATFDGRTEMARFPSSAPPEIDDMNLEMSLDVVLDEKMPAGGHSLVPLAENLLNYVLVEVARPLKRFLS